MQSLKAIFIALRSKCCLKLQSVRLSTAVYSSVVCVDSLQVQNLVIVKLCLQHDFVTRVNQRQLILVNVARNYKRQVRVGELTSAESCFLLEARKLSNVVNIPHLRRTRNSNCTFELIPRTLQ